MLASTWEKRRTLAARTTAYRWLDEELAGVTIDLFGEVAVLSEYRTFEAAEEAQLADEVMFAAPMLKALYVKRRPREARKASKDNAEWVAPVQPLKGKPVSELTVTEEGRTFGIRPDNGLSVGLYLDARDARTWVQRHALGRRVLNLFAYTCGFGVAAALGKASRVVNLDVSRRVLEWGRKNYALNGLPANDRDFIFGDALQWLPRLAKKDERFDMVVVDPPSFATTKSSRFSAQADYGKLTAACLPLLAKGGLLVACCNLEEWKREQFQHVLEAACRQRPVRRVAQLGASASDFRQPSALKVEVLEL